jgi:uncharacterized repeat protein (TIGR03803 family)
VTTRLGFPEYFGAVFKISIDGTELTALHNFGQYDGIYPNAGLIQGSDGAFYGTAQEGGLIDFGTAFRLTTRP